jgi:hypothetical protein
VNKLLLIKFLKIGFVFLQGTLCSKALVKIKSQFFTEIKQ